MGYRKLALSAAFVVTAGLAGVTAAAAQTTVRMLHVEQNPDNVAYWNDIARRYEAKNPGVKVDVQYLENESYKKKLTTLLQSPDKPNIIYSWAGGVLREQVKAGVIEDLSGMMDASWRERFVPAAVQAYTVNDKLYGVPMHTSQVGFFYNKDLFAKAGVDAATIKTWDDLLGAVKKIQAAGITPIIAGGADKWPLHFYWSHLAIRIGGKDAFEAAMRGEGKGFADATFVKAGEQFKQLVDLKPFQSGFLGVTYPQSAGQFGDGKGAMMLMLNGLLNSMRANSADKRGIPEDKLGWFAFPTVPGGKGDPSDTLGGLNGWLVTKGSPKEAVDFLRFFSEPENQRIAAERGFYIPVVKGTQDAIKHPILRQLAENVANSKYHQIFYDQMLGPSVGAVVNDISADLAGGRIKPAEAAQAVQEAWQLAN
ncbi:MAG TPA: extracellular solute-binding protein [Microvirga sp.]|nr:extracellular solute-binding protein [Microvirga sp.]